MAENTDFYNDIDELTVFNVERSCVANIPDQLNEAVDLTGALLQISKVSNRTLHNNLPFVVFLF